MLFMGGEQMKTIPTLWTSHLMQISRASNVDGPTQTVYPRLKVVFLLTFSTLKVEEQVLDQN